MYTHLQDWQTFPEFLDHLDRRPAVMDFAAQIGHVRLMVVPWLHFSAQKLVACNTGLRVQGAIRSFVMGERAVDPAAQPTAEELQAMADVVQEAIEAGASGFSSTL